MCMCGLKRDPAVSSNCSNRAPPLLLLSPVLSPEHAASRSNVSEPICAGHYCFSNDSPPPAFPSGRTSALPGGKGERGSDSSDGEEGFRRALMEQQGGRLVKDVT